MRLFVFGFGYTAAAAVRRLAPRLDRVWGTTRQAEKMAAIEAAGVRPLLFDGAAQPDCHPRAEQSGDPRAQNEAQGSGSSGLAFGSPEDDRLGTDGREAVSEALAEASHVLVSIAPGAAGDPVLTHFCNDLAALKPRALVYLSTVGVYGDHGGAWVDEASACRPVSARSRRRLEAEAAWRLFGEETGTPAAILRLAGIYGPGRSPFDKLRDGTARRIVKPGQVFNRIHVDDIAAAVDIAIDIAADVTVNVADDEPAPPNDVVAHAAALLGLPPPPEEAFDSADLSPMARSFYGENKRVRNDRLKRELGVRLAYPSYREGLAAILAGTARAAPR
ncbi:MAG TPA: SDR family oxidoreductase [Afifellaceae bacterium]|nr:SDR family oxidoreductase [Afifellaceae bacterium]